MGFKRVSFPRQAAPHGKAAAAADVAGGRPLQGERDLGVCHEGGRPLTGEQGGLEIFICSAPPPPAAFASCFAVSGRVERAAGERVVMCCATRMRPYAPSTRERMAARRRCVEAVTFCCCLEASLRWLLPVVLCLFGFDGARQRCTARLFVPRALPLCHGQAEPAPRPLQTADERHVKKCCPSPPLALLRASRRLTVVQHTPPLTLYRTPASTPSTTQ